MIFAPLDAWRHVKVTGSRTMIDWAHCIRDLVDVHFPEAETITIVQDNLNTHKPASLYQAFAPEEARRLLDKLEFVYTPKHGSWLNTVRTRFTGYFPAMCPAWGMTGWPRSNLASWQSNVCISVSLTKRL